MQVWDRRKHVPASVYCDPLCELFDEFDQDNDGHLTATEIHDVLQGQGVSISCDQVRSFIRDADADGNEQIEKEEFETFLYGLANADRMSEL